MTSSGDSDRRPVSSAGQTEPAGSILHACGGPHERLVVMKRPHPGTTQNDLRKPPHLHHCRHRQWEWFHMHALQHPQRVDPQASSLHPTPLPSVPARQAMECRSAQAGWSPLGPPFGAGAVQSRRRPSHVGASAHFPPLCLPRRGPSRRYRCRRAGVWGAPQEKGGAQVRGGGGYFKSAVHRRRRLADFAPGLRSFL